MIVFFSNTLDWEKGKKVFLGEKGQGGNRFGGFGGFQVTAGDV